MWQRIDRLVGEFEQGKLTRRELVSMLGMIAGAGAAAAQSKPNTIPFPVKTLNHVTFMVSDLSRSRKFYEGVLGMPVLGQNDTECDFAVSGGFLAAGVRGERPAGIHHFCVGVEGYDANGVATALKDRGLKPTVRTSLGAVRFAEPQVYVEDPDGVVVQLGSPNYRGPFAQ